MPGVNSAQSSHNGGGLKGKIGGLAWHRSGKDSGSDEVFEAM